MKALILVGGFGTRLKEVIHDRPKVMAMINGRPFLEYVFAVLRKNRIEEVIFCVGYLGDYIRSHFGKGKDFGVNISYSTEDYPLGTGGAVKRAEKFLESTFLVINGDTYLDLDIKKMLSFHQKKKAGVTIALARRQSTLETGLISMQKSGKISSFLEKPKKDKEGLVNTGYYIFEKKILKLIKKGKRSSLENDLFPSLVKKGILYGFEVNKDFIDIGTPENYQKARRVLSKKKERW